jgi:hypothetical protein
VKLFQIEEPDGSPADPTAPGAAIGIDASGTEIEVAFSIGGNAVVLADREGYGRALAIPDPTAATAQWQELFEAARIRAERALARPVSHAVIVLAAAVDADRSTKLCEAAEVAGLSVLRLIPGAAPSPEESAVLAAAILAEDLAPRPE